MDKAAVRNVVVPVPHPEPASRLSSETRVNSFCAMLQGDDDT